MGAAEVFAAHLRMASFRAVCEEALIQLINSPYEKVCAQAGSCFHGYEREELGAYEGLLKAFVPSLACVVRDGFTCL
jgi:hypothetical protein